MGKASASKMPGAARKSAAGIWAILAALLFWQVGCTSSQVNQSAPSSAEISPLIINSPIRVELPAEGAVRFVDNTEVTVAGTTRPRTMVSLTQPDGLVRQVESDDNGRYRILNVPVIAAGVSYRLDTGDRVPDGSNVVNDQRVPVTGFAQPGALVTLSVANTSTTLAVRADGAGAFEFPDVPFNEGPNEFQIDMDVSGAQTTRAVFEFTLDTTAPVVTFVGVTTGEVLDQSTVSITGRLSENNVTIEYTDPETGAAVSFVNTSLNFDLPFFAFPDGRHNLELRFIDSVGNTTERILSFQVDSQAPNVVFTSPTLRRDFLTTVLEAEITNRLQSLQGFTSPDARIDAIFLDTDATYSGAANSDGSFVVPVFHDAFGHELPYVPGENRLRVLVSDAAGNTTDIRINLIVPENQELPPPLAMDYPQQGEAVSTFDRDRAALLSGCGIVDEVIATQSAADTSFSGQLNGADLTSMSLQITDPDGIVFSVTAPNTLTASMGGHTGTINEATGDWTLSYLAAPSIGDIVASYGHASPGCLDPSIEVAALTGADAPFVPLNFALDGRRVGAPTGADRFVRCDPTMAGGYAGGCVQSNDRLCLENPAGVSNPYPELRDLSEEGSFENIIRVDNDPSCDREVPPPPAALPDAGSNGCFSMPDGSRFRVVHVTRESPPSGACPAGTTETRILGPLVPTQWLQSEGAICADPQMLGRCPFPAAMDSIDSITLQPDGIMQLDFDINAPVNPLCDPVRPTDLLCANDGFPIKAGDRLVLRVTSLIGTRTLEVKEVLSDSQIRTDPIVDKPITVNSPNLFVKIDRSSAFTISDTMTDAQGRLSEGRVASGHPLEYQQLFGALVPVPLNIPESQHISMVAGREPLTTRAETGFRVLNPSRARIQVLNPTNGLVTTDDSVIVEGYVIGDPDAQAVEINGRVVDVDASGRFRLDRLRLEFGEVNNIQVTLVDTNGTVVTEQRTIVQAGSAILSTDVSITPATTPAIVSGVPGDNVFFVTGTLSDNVDVLGVVVAAGEEGGELIINDGCPSDPGYPNATLTINSGGYVPGFAQSDLRDLVNGVGGACGAPPCDVNANPSILYVVDGPSAGASIRIDDASAPNVTLEEAVCAPGSRLMLLQRNLLIPDRTVVQLPEERWSITGTLVSPHDRAFFHQFNFGFTQDQLLEISLAGLQDNQPGALDTDSVGVLVRTDVPFLRLTSPVRFSGADAEILTAGSPECLAVNCNCVAPMCDAVLRSPSSAFFVDVAPANAPIVPFSPQFEDIAIRPGDLVATGAGHRTTSSNEHRYFLVSEEYDGTVTDAATQLKLISVDRVNLAPNVLTNPVANQPGTRLSFSVYPRLAGQSVEPGPGLPAAPAETNQPILTRETEVDFTGFTSVPDAVVVTDGILGESFRDGTFFVREVPVSEGINLIDVVAEDSAGRRTTQYVAIQSDPRPPHFSNICLAIDNSVAGTPSDVCGATQASVPPVPAPFLGFPSDTASATVRSPLVELRGLLIDENAGSGVRSIDVLINDEVIQHYDEFTGLNDPLDGTGLFAHSLQLDPGANLYTLRATDRAGNVSEIKVLITADLPDPRPPSVRIDCVTDPAAGILPGGAFAGRNALTSLVPGSRQIIGVGDGLTADFNYTMPRGPVQPGTVMVTDGVETCADDGAGGLLCTGGGTNTINYATGDVEVSFALPSPAGAAVEVDYTRVLNPAGNPARAFCTHARKDDSNFSEADNPVTPVDMRSPPAGMPGGAPAIVPVDDRIVSSGQAVLTGAFLARNGVTPALAINGKTAGLELSGMAPGLVRPALGPISTGRAGQSIITVSTPVSELCYCPLADAGGAASCMPGQLVPVLQVGDSVALVSNANAQAANNGLYTILNVSSLCTFQQFSLDRPLVVDAYNNPASADAMLVQYEHTFLATAVDLLNEGFNSLAIEASDEEGRVSLQSFGVIRDTNPPALTIQGAVDGFSISAVAPAVIVTDPNLCTSELVCPTGGLDPNLFGPGLPGAGEQAMHIIVDRLDDNGEAPVEIPGDSTVPAVHPVLRGRPLRYGWAYFADNMATPGVVDPVAVPYDAENWDGEPAGALNPFSVPLGYPSPYTARDPNDGTPTLTPPPQVTGEVVLTNGGAASAGPFSGQVVNTPVVADIPFALTKTAPPETCADVNHDGDFNDPGECVGGSGTINYLTGAFTITFATPVPMGTNITADYAHADPLFPFVSSKSIVTLGISTASNEANVATSPFPGDVSCYNSYGTVDDLQPGTGAMGPYDQTTGALSAPPLADGTFTLIHVVDPTVLNDEMERCTDADFDGNITSAECTGPVLSTATGTVDYAARTYSITFTSAVAATDVVRATYNRVEGAFEAPLQLGNGTNGPYNDIGGALDVLPIADGSFTLIHYSPAGEVERCTDADFDGTITNAECTGGAGSGTIDYISGQYTITFTNVVAMTDEIQAFSNASTAIPNLEAPRPCRARSPVTYRLTAYASDRAGHGAAADVSFDVVITPEVRLISGGLGLISENPAIVRLISDTTELRTLLLDRLDDSGVLYNQNLVMAQILGDLEDPGPLASELIESGARDAFSGLLAALLSDPDEFGPAQSAMATLLDVVRLLIDNGTADDLLPIIDNRFILNTCTDGGACPTGPDGTAIFRFLSDILVSRNSADRTDYDGDNEFFRTVPGPVRNLLPLNKSLLSFENSVRLRGQDLNTTIDDPLCPTTAGGNTAQINALPGDNLGFQSLVAVPNSVVNVQVGDRLRIVSGPCNGFETEISQVLDNDTVCIDPLTAFAGCGASNSFVVVYPNGPAQIPVVELLDLLIHSPQEVIFNPNNILGDAGVFRSLSHVIEELFCSDSDSPDCTAPGVPRALDTDDLNGLFHALYQLTDDGSEFTGSEFSTRLIDEIAVLLSAEDAPLVQGRGEALQIEKLFPIIDSILAGERDPLAPVDRCTADPMTPGFQPGLLDLACWAQGTVDLATNNDYATMRHMDMLLASLEAQARPTSTGESMLVELLRLSRELIDDPDDNARGYLGPGLPSPPNTNDVQESVVATLSPVLLKVIQNEIFEDVIMALSDLLNPRDETTLMARTFNGDLVNYDEEFVPVIHQSLELTPGPLAPSPDPIESNPPLLRAIALPGTVRIDSSFDGVDDTSGIRGIAEALRSLVTPIGEFGLGEGRNPGYPAPVPDTDPVDTPVCREMFFNGRSPIEVLVPILDQLLEPLPRRAPMVGETAEDVLNGGEDVLGRDRLTIILQGLFDDPHVDEQELPDEIDDCENPCRADGTPTGGAPGTVLVGSTAGDGIAVSMEVLEILPELVNTLTRFGFAKDGTLTSIFDTTGEDVNSCVAGDCYAENRLLPAQAMMIDLGLELDAPFQVGAGEGIIAFDESLTQEALDAFGAFDNGEDAVNYLLLIAAKIAEDIQPINASTPLPQDTTLAPAASKLLADPDGDGDPIPDGVIDDLLPIVRMISNTGMTRQTLDMLRAVRACGVDASAGNAEIRGGALLRAVLDSTLLSLPALSGATDALCPAEAEAMGPGVDGRGNTGGPFDVNVLNRLMPPELGGAPQSPSTQGTLQGGFEGRGNTMGEFFDPNVDFRELGVGRSAHLCLIAPPPVGTELIVEQCAFIDARPAAGPNQPVSYSNGNLFTDADGMGDDLQSFVNANCPRDGSQLGVGIGMGSAGQLVYQGFLPDEEIFPGTLLIDVDAGVIESFVDNGDGTLSGTVDVLAGGTINYNTGRYTLIFNAAPGVSAFTASYDFDPQQFCSWRIRMMAEPYNGCVGGEPIPGPGPGASLGLGETLGSPVSSTNQSYLDFVLRSVAFLVRKSEGFVLPEPIPAGPTPAGYGRLTKLLDLMVSPVPLPFSNGADNPILLDVAPVAEKALRILVDPTRFPVRAATPIESPLESALRVANQAMVELDAPMVGPQFGTLPFDSYPTSEIIYLSNGPFAANCPDGLGGFRACVGNGVHDSIDLALIGLNSVLDQLEVRDGQNGLTRHYTSPESGDVVDPTMAPVCADPASPECGFSDDPAELFEFLGERLPIALERLEPGLQILLESFDVVSRVGEFDPLYPSATYEDEDPTNDCHVNGLNDGQPPCVNAADLAAAVERLAYTGNCRPHMTGEPTNCRIANVDDALGAPAPLGAEGLVLEGVVNDGALQTSTTTFDNLIGQWMVRPNDPTNYPEGILHRERVLSQFAMLGRIAGVGGARDLEGAFQFLR
ncbi:MAG: hypothetical protein KDH09_19355, partial [Chrysiogenetes bacterium]|nr:hypothetical protein [Chrysiogenetes bacterium]